jgi:hypothetical protein
MTTPSGLRDLPLPTRLACIGAISAGTTGAVVGLVVGLVTYAPTAWFAVFEAGLPAAIAGGTVSLLAGVAGAFATNITRRVRGREARSPR